MNKKLRWKYELKDTKKMRFYCNPDEFGIKTTKELNPGLDSLIIGQEKGIEAVRHGLEMQDSHNNIYVSTPKGIDKKRLIEHLVRDYLESLPPQQKKQKLDQRKDLVSVHNFNDPDQPIILYLPSGKGEKFQNMLKVISQTLPTQIMEDYKQWLESKYFEFSQRIGILNQQMFYSQREADILEQKGKNLSAQLRKRLNEAELKGNPLPEEELEEKQKKINECFEKVKQLDMTAAQLNQKIKEFSFKFQKQLMKQTEDFMQNYEVQKVKPLIDKKLKEEFVDSRIKLLEKLINEYRENNMRIINKNEKFKRMNNAEKRRVFKILEDKLKRELKLRDYIETYQKELVGEVKSILYETLKSKSKTESNPELQLLGLGGVTLAPQKTTINYTKYQGKLIAKVDREETINGVPVIFEDKPTMERLFGTTILEKASVVGGLGQIVVKDDQHFRLKSGSLLRANGGYLILDLMKMLSEDAPAFYRLIKDLDSGKTRIEDRLAAFFKNNVYSEDIEFNVKVILYGPESVYQRLLYLAEDGILPEFQKTFKVKAPLDSIVKNSSDSRKEYINFISEIVREEGLKHVTSDGLAEIISQATRLGHKGKLTTDTDTISNLLREANKEAKNDDYITAEHVKKAVFAKDRRHNMIEEKYREYIEDGTFIIDTQGEAVGEINGLAVSGRSDILFGIPTKITVNASKGTNGVTSLDISAGYAGSSFTKAVHTLTQNMKRIFAQENRINFEAGISFEQSYWMLDGDSATLAKFLGLISELGDAPIDQGIAVTGSLSQKGLVQPIGGVNEKIEGFYKTCKITGLTGEQGVIIPKINEKELQLSDEVIKAVEEGQFHIYPVRRPEEAIEIIMGVKPCDYDENGKIRITEGTLYHKVLEKIKCKDDASENSDRNEDNVSETKKPKCNGCEK